MRAFRRAFCFYSEQHMIQDTHVPGIVTALVASPWVQLGDCMANAMEMTVLVRDAARQKASLVLFPELSVTGATCMDLFGQQALRKAALEALRKLMEDTAGLPLTVVTGMPLETPRGLADVAVVLSQGHVQGVVPRMYHPTGPSMLSRRWFVPGTQLQDVEVVLDGRRFPLASGQVFRADRFLFGVEVGADVWAPVPPHAAMQGCNLVLVPSAMPCTAGSHEALCRHLASESARCRCTMLYAAAGWGESSTDLVHDGALLSAADGRTHELGRRMACGVQSAQVAFTVPVASPEN